MRCFHYCSITPGFPLVGILMYSWSRGQLGEWKNGDPVSRVAHMSRRFLSGCVRPSVMGLGTVSRARTERHARSEPILPPLGRCVGPPDDVFPIATRRQRKLNSGLARPLHPSPARRLHPDKKRRDVGATHGQRRA